MIKIFIFVFQHWWNRYWGSHFWHLSVQTVSHNYYMYNRKVLVFIYHCFFQLGNQIIHFEKKIGKSFGILHDFKIICIGKCAYKSTKPALKNHCLIHVLNIMLCKKRIYGEMPNVYVSHAAQRLTYERDSWLETGSWCGVVSYVLMHQNSPQHFACNSSSMYIWYSIFIWKQVFVTCFCMPKMSLFMSTILFHKCHTFLQNILCVNFFL